ncbi:hypothetical protein [Legionella birminghamensis]|nr:hypothetical protein [Legionella birminghamensis]
MKLLIVLLLFPMTVFASEKTLSCSMPGLAGGIQFTLDGKSDSLPEVDFPYEVKTTAFSMRDDNLLLIAMDSEDKSRPRLFISAQWEKQSKSWQGQFFADFGGHQLQFENGKIECK